MSIYGSVLNSCVYISLYPCFEKISFEVGHLYQFKLGIRIFRQELGWLAINQIVKITEHFLPFIVLAANFRRLCYIKWMQLPRLPCRGVKTYSCQRSVIKKIKKSFSWIFKIKHFLQYDLRKNCVRKVFTTDLMQTIASKYIV